jgi:hypothetical protein
METKSERNKLTCNGRSKPRVRNVGMGICEGFDGNGGSGGP